MIEIHKLANIVVVPLLRSPFHSLLSHHRMLISFAGRYSGIIFTIPVRYQRRRRQVFFLTRRDAIWWKNLLDRAPVSVWLEGQEINGFARRVSEDENVIRDQLLQVSEHMTYDQAARRAPHLVLIEVMLAEEPVTSAPAATRRPAH